MRDNNFTNTIKVKAAQKVGYLCSCPSCRRITIGSHSSDDKIIKIGEGAHIYAASKGGKRYNPSKSASFVKSEENCLWLCSTHHTLVDSDEAKYSAEVLLKWKKEAEEETRRQLETSTIEFSDIKKKKIDISILEKVFGDYFNDGKIIKLFQLILFFEKELLDVNYYPLYSYYKVKIYYFNERNNVKNELTNLIKYQNQDYIKKAIDFLIANLESNTLNEFKMFIPEDRKEIAEIVINNQIIGKLITFSHTPIEGNERAKKNDLSKVLYSQILSNYLSTNYLSLGYGITNIFDKDGKLYSGDIFSKIKGAIYQLGTKIYKDHNFIKEGLIFLDNDFVWLNSLRKNVIDFDYETQKHYWKFMLSVQKNQKEFMDIYGDIPESIKIDPIFELMRFHIEVANSPLTVSVKHLIDVSEKASDYNLLFDYLRFLYTKNPGSFLDAFEENPNLVFINSNILSLYVDGLFEFKNGISVNDIEKTFQKKYEGDYLYHVILMKLNVIENEKVEYLKQFNLAKKILSNGAICSTYSLNYYISVLKMDNDFQSIYELIDLNVPMDSKLYIAEIIVLANNNWSHKVCQFLEVLLQKGSENKDILRILGIYYQNVKNIERSKELFKTAYEKYNDIQSAYNYFVILLNTSDEIKPEYIAFCEQYKTPLFLKLLIGMYVSNCEFAKAKEKYMSYLSIEGEKDQSIFGHYFGLATRYPNLEKNNAIVLSGYTAILEDDKQNILKISIHNGEIISSGIEHSFFGCIHFNKDEKEVKDIVFKTIKDVVLFESIKYTINNVIKSEALYCDYSIRKLQEMNLAQLFKADPKNPEMALNQIIEIIEENKKTTGVIINDYNETPITPISFLAKQLGKSLVEILENFLFTNKQRIKNNLDFIVCKKFLLSYDVIIPLYHLNIKNLFSANFTFFITQSAKESFLKYIKEEFLSLQSDKEKGYLAVRDEGPVFYKNDTKTRSKRLVYLEKLKDFINSFKVISKSPDVLIPHKVAEIFKENNLPLETEMMEVLFSHDEIGVLTDNIFISACAKLINKTSSGTIGLLLDNILFPTDSILLEAIKRFEKMNYDVYLSLPILRKYYSLLPFQRKNTFVNLINGKEFCFSDEDNLVHHKKMIISILQTLEENGVDDEVANKIKAVGLEFFKELYRDNVPNINREFPEG